MAKRLTVKAVNERVNQAADLVRRLILSSQHHSHYIKQLERRCDELEARIEQLEK